MKINKDNYEVYFIDYYDGELSDDEINMLFNFLSLNPDYKEEFEDFENITLHPEESIVYNKKSNLKKNEITPHQHINENNFETFFCAYFEKDLSEKEEEQVLTFLSLNPHLESVFKLYSKLYLKANEDDVFVNKEKLKISSTNNLIDWNNSFIKIAAMLLLFVGLYIVFDKSYTKSDIKNIQPIASIHQNKINQQFVKDIPIKRSSNYDINDDNIAQDIKVYHYNSSKRIKEKPLKLNMNERVSNINPLRFISTKDLAIIDIENSFKDIDYRFEQTIRYYYSKNEQEQAFRYEVLSYQEKSGLGKLIYYISNKLEGNDNMYIVMQTDEDFLNNNYTLEQLAKAVNRQLTNVKNIIKSPDRNISLKPEGIEIDY